MDSGEQDRLHVLESRFDLNDRRVWFGRAKLLPDLMLLRGIGYERRIMLQDIRTPGALWAQGCHTGWSAAGRRQYPYAPF